jgi:hypothetical protein
MHLMLSVYGTQEPIENWVIGDVTLPLRPNQVTDDNPAQTENFDKDGEAPIIFSTSPGTRTLTLNGSISSRDSTKTQLGITYLTPLRAMKGTVVCVVDPNQIYIGDWMVKQVTFREVAEGSKVARFTYQIVLVQGSAYVDLSQESGGGGPM